MDIIALLLLPLLPTPMSCSDISIAPLLRSSTHLGPCRLPSQWRRNQWCRVWVRSKCNIFYLHIYPNPGTEVVKQHTGQSLLSGIRSTLTVPREQLCLRNWLHPEAKAESKISSCTSSFSKTHCLYTEPCTPKTNTNTAGLPKTEHFAHKLKNKILETLVTSAIIVLNDWLYQCYFSTWGNYCHLYFIKEYSIVKMW